MTRPAKGPSGVRRTAAREAVAEEEATEAEEGCIPGRRSLEQPLLTITSTPLRDMATPAAAAGAWPRGGGAHASKKAGGVVRRGEREGERERVSRRGWIRWCFRGEGARGGDDSVVVSFLFFFFLLLASARLGVGGGDPFARQSVNDELTVGEGLILSPLFFLSLSFFFNGVQ